MERRRFLVTAGTVAAIATAGCMGNPNPETEGNDDSPIESNPEDLIPPRELFGEGWEEDNGRTDDSEARGSYSNPDEQIMAAYQLTIYESVEEAESAYQNQREQDFAAAEQNAGWSAEELEIASESHIAETSIPIVWFRDANVVAEMSHRRFSGGGNSSKSIEYAAAWHETWR